MLSDLNPEPCSRVSLQGRRPGSPPLTHPGRGPGRLGGRLGAVHLPLGPRPRPGPDEDHRRGHRDGLLLPGGHAAGSRPPRGHGQVRPTGGRIVQPDGGQPSWFICVCPSECLEPRWRLEENYATLLFLVTSPKCTTCA